MQTTCSESPLTLLELDAILAEDEKIQERRSQDRIEHQTRAQVICMRVHRASVRSDVSLAWTEDISATGAKLAFAHPVPEERFWLRFSGTKYGGAFIECRVQWSASPSVDAASGRVELLHLCGVQFGHELSREDFEQVLARDHSDS